MAKNDVDKLHEQKAERGGREGRGEKGKKERGGGEKKKTSPSTRAEAERNASACIRESRTEAGRTGEMERGRRGRGRNNEGVILEN